MRRMCASNEQSTVKNRMGSRPGKKTVLVADRAWGMPRCVMPTSGTVLCSTRNASPRHYQRAILLIFRFILHPSHGPNTLMCHTCGGHCPVKNS